MFCHWIAHYANYAHYAYVLDLPSLLLFFNTSHSRMSKSESESNNNINYMYENDETYGPSFNKIRASLQPNRIRQESNAMANLEHKETIRGLIGDDYTTELEEVFSNPALRLQKFELVRTMREGDLDGLVIQLTDLRRQFFPELLPRSLTLNYRGNLEPIVENGYYNFGTNNRTIRGVPKLHVHRNLVNHNNNRLRNTNGKTKHRRIMVKHNENTKKKEANEQAKRASAHSKSSSRNNRHKSRNRNRNRTQNRKRKTNQRYH